MKIIKYDESHLKIFADMDEAINLSEFFAYYSPNYLWSPKYKAGIWDGKIRLFNKNTGLLPQGCLPRFKEYVQQFGIDCEFDPELSKNKGPKLSEDNIIKFVNTMMQCKHVPHDYQVFAVQYLSYLKKGVILSSTASGKSYIAFMLFNIMRYMCEDFKFLLMVPTTSLVEQMAGDFQEYAENFCDYSQYVHKVYSKGSKPTVKQTDRPITISTWQSLQKMPPSYFNQFDVVMVDEVHTATAAVISKLMSYCTSAQFKWGMTGTIDDTDTEVPKWQLNSLFGPIKKITTTKDLIERQILAKLKIFGVVFNYNDDTKKLMKGLDYDSERKAINQSEIRLKYIKNLVKKRATKNSMVLFKSREYGKSLAEQFKQIEGKKVFYIDGTVKTDYREKVRKYCEKHEGCIIVASYGTFSTGINIKNLHNIFFAESMKSLIKIIQSIGRSLRKHDTKDFATLYDITDDFSIKSRKNHTLKHFFKRIGYYEKEEHTYKIIDVNIKG